MRLDRDNICDLLAPDEADRFGSKDPRATNSFRTGNPQCVWGGEIAIVFEFAFEDSYNAEPQAEQIELAGQDALLIPVNNDVGNPICKTVIEVNQGRSWLSMGASVLTAGEGKGYKPCEMAKQLAEIVIPKVKG